MLSTSIEMALQVLSFALLVRSIPSADLPVLGRALVIYRSAVANTYQNLLKRELFILANGLRLLNPAVAGLFPSLLLNQYLNLKPDKLPLIAT